MARGLNKVMIIGELGQDPHMRYTPGGKPMASFSVGASRSWTSSNGERHQKTEWFNVVVWGHLAEICNRYLSKGRRVYVEGRLQIRSWEDDEGKKHYRTELAANEMIMLDSQGERKETSEESSF